MTPLKPLFHRQFNTEGNINTPNIARHAFSKNVDTVMFHSTIAATYKHIIQFSDDAKEEVSLYSIDTGLNENPFQGNYFDMNEAHRSGNLHNMKTDR